MHWRYWPQHRAWTAAKRHIFSVVQVYACVAADVDGLVFDVWVWWVAADLDGLVFEGCVVVCR